MSCSEFEKQIILYSELTTEEQDEVNTHVQECESCARFFESQTNINNLIRQAAGIKPEPLDQHALTRNIMAKVEAHDQGRWKIFDFTPQPVQYNFARYGMAAISVGLLVFFGVELFAPGQQENTAPEAAKSIVLNRKDFREKLLNTKSISRFSLASQCKSPFNITKVDANCMRQKLGYL